MGSYPQNQFYDDMMRVTHGLSDPELAQILVSQSFPAMKWLREKGVRFVLSFGRQAFKDGDKYRFWGGLLVEAVGAGKGLSDQQFEACAREGVEVRYSTQGVSLVRDQQGRVAGLRVLGPDGYEDIAARSVVLAAGGFEANAEMRSRYLGPGWELVKVRGIPYNTGDGIRMALEAGAQAHGHWSSCHAVAWDMNAPPFGDRNITELFQKHSYPFGLIVNLEGNRFLDEGADFRNYTYVTYGRALLGQPQGLAFQIFDDKVKHLLRDEYHIPQVTMAQADTIEELAARLDIDPAGLAETIRQYNAAVQTDVPYNPTVKDGRGTVGITPPKTNWAHTIDTPPYLGYAVTCGISFTFGGVKIDNRGRVVTNAQEPIPGLVRRRRNGGRPVLPQLSGRLRPVGRHGLRPPGRFKRRPGRNGPKGLKTDTVPSEGSPERDHMKLHVDKEADALYLRPRCLCNCRVGGGFAGGGVGLQRSERSRGGGDAPPLQALTNPQPVLP